MVIHWYDYEKMDMSSHDIRDLTAIGSKAEFALNALEYGRQFFGVASKCRKSTTGSKNGTLSKSTKPAKSGRALAMILPYLLLWSIAIFRSHVIQKDAISGRLCLLERMYIQT
ncbi:hypothetical protein GJ496_001561 [Pomphorhynchus laevis]|nr:hypothetical protein GJ496_001561 [Pomphorhynchus laevis]